MREFNVFLTILCILFLIKYTSKVFLKIWTEDLTPIKISKWEEMLLFFSFAYIITNIIL